MRVPQLDWNTWHWAPPVTSLTLFKGWTDKATTSLQGAATKLLEKHPPLGGALVQNLDGSVEIREGVHLNPVRILHGPIGPSMYTVPATLAEQVHDLQHVLEPCLLAQSTSIGSADAQVASGGPLFQVVVMKLAGDAACCLVELSHIIGDGHCYYQVIAALHAILNSAEPVKIHWGLEGSPPVPAHFSPRDLSRLALPMKYAFPLQQRFGAARHSHLAITDAEALAQCKVSEASTSAAGFVSANDVLMSAISEVLTPDLMIMNVNMRGRVAAATREYGGNYEQNVFFPRKAAASRSNGPAFLRDTIMRQLYFYGTNEVPYWPFLCNSVGIVSNWATITEFFLPPGTTVLAHVPLSSFVRALPRDLCVIFKPSPTAPLALNHNFLVETRGFQARVAKSHRWKRLVHEIGCGSKAEQTLGNGVRTAMLCVVVAGLAVSLISLRCRRKL